MTNLHKKIKRLFSIKRHKTFAAVFFAFLLTGGLLLAVSPAVAQAGIGLEDIAKGIIQGITWLVLQIATICIQLTIFLLRFFITIAGYNNYINSPVVLVGWNMVRDVANMFFVVVLMVIAFGTILGLEQYEWRKTLAKLVIAAIFVNFSNLILQLIIDVAQVFTVTFLNALAGAAGGNLIQMLNFREIFELAVGADAAARGDIQLEIFGASVMALFFAAIALFAMGAYTIVVLARMVALWVAIIFSPIAFLLSVLPQTKSYADEFWKEFIHHVLAAPVLVFFLWLAFGTFGQGFLSHIEGTDGSGPHPIGRLAVLSEAEETGTIQSERPGASFNKAATWDRMANFAVAIAFLVIGIDRVKKLGVTGGGLASGALKFAKNVVTIASGVALGKAAYEGIAKPSAGYLIKKAPFIGTEKLGRYRDTFVEGVKGHIYDAGYAMRLSKKGKEAKEQLDQKQKELDLAASPEAQQALEADIATREDRLKELAQLGQQTPEQQREKAALEASVAADKETLAAASGITGDGLAALQKEVKGLEAEVAKESSALPLYTPTGFAGWLARKDIQSEKRMAKTRDQAEGRRKLLWKRTGSESGGYLVGMGTKGFFGAFGDRYADADSQSRVEEGWLQGEQLRADAKDREYHAMGRKEILGSARIKFDVNKNKLGLETKKGTMAERIAQRDLAAEFHEQGIKGLETKAKLKLHEEGAYIERGYLGKDEGLWVDGAKRGRITDDLIHKMEAMNKINMSRLEDLEREGLDQAMINQYKHGALLDAGASEVENGLYDDDAIDLASSIDKLRQEIASLEAEGIRLDKAQQSAETDYSQLLEAAQDTKLSGTEKLEAEQRARDARTAMDAAVAAKTQFDQNNATDIASKRADLASEQKKRETVLSTLASQAEAVREGNMEAIQDIIQKLRSNNDSRAERWETISRAVKSGAVEAWQYGTQKALAEEKRREHSYTHNTLLSDAEQKTVWDKRSIDTPTSALTEPIEEYERGFSDMSVSQYVDNAGKALLTAIRRKKAGENITDGDRSALVGLFKRGFNGAWLDDTISAIMADPSAKKEIAMELGWDDNEEFTTDKIRDIQMLYATGDIDFAKKHVVVSDVIDAAMTKGLGLSKDEIFKGFETGTFRDASTTAAVKQAVTEYYQQAQRTLTAEQETMSQELLNGAGKIGDYLKTVEDNQAQFQFLGNLRDQAISGGHGENSGWSISSTVGGKTMYMPTSVREARNHVFGDVNKMDTRDRARFHTHMFADLLETNGQVVTNVREEDLAIARNGINDNRTFNGTRQRTLKHLLGFAAADQLHEFMNDAGRLELGSSANVVNAYREKFADQFTGVLRGSAQERAVVSKIMMNNVISKVIRTNSKDFALLASAATGGNQIEAINEGKIQLEMYNPAKKKMVQYTTVQAMIKDYNNGDFGAVSDDKKLKQFVKSVSKMTQEEKEALQRDTD